MVGWGKGAKASREKQNKFNNLQNADFFFPHVLSNLFCELSD